jgi:hypothetical protein
MHALVVRVKIDAARAEEARQLLENGVVPMSRQRPGFTAGYWLRGSDGARGMSVELYETEAAARAIADAPGDPPPDSPVTLEGFDVYEVVATA